MENFFVKITDIFGLKTVLSSVIVCVVISAIKKKKPTLSVRAEIVIRLLLSALIHTVYLIITQGNFASFPQDITEICGVSMILCGLASKSVNNLEMSRLILALIPSLDESTLSKLINAKSQKEIIEILTDCELEFTQPQIDLILAILNKHDKT